MMEGGSSGSVEGEKNLKELLVEEDAFKQAGCVWYRATCLKASLNLNANQLASLNIYKRIMKLPMDKLREEATITCQDKVRSSLSLPLSALNERASERMNE
jgi:hypothetical protein